MVLISGNNLLRQSSTWRINLRHPHRTKARALADRSGGCGASLTKSTADKDLQAMPQTVAATVIDRRA
jgi:hypothetical protein